MRNFKELFPNQQPVLGVIHLYALPGTPNYKGNDSAILKQALKEAKIYQDAAVDGIILENMHDAPYLKNEVGHEISTMMSVIAYEVKKQTQLPCGVQVLAGANQAALSVAKAAQLDFIRVEGFVYAHIADEGYIEACAGPLLRFRKQIEAEQILVLSDIKKKHSAHAITLDIDLVETAKTAAFFGSDGVIVSGSFTGAPANIEELQSLKTHSTLPVLLGSGVQLENVQAYFPLCEGMIVGSYFKKDGKWYNAVDSKRVSQFMKKIKRLRG